MIQYIDQLGPAPEGTKAIWGWNHLPYEFRGDWEQVEPWSSKIEVEGARVLVWEEDKYVFWHPDDGLYYQDGYSWGRTQVRTFGPGEQTMFTSGEVSSLHRGQRVRDFILEGYHLVRLVKPWVQRDRFLWAGQWWSYKETLTGSIPVADVGKLAVKGDFIRDGVLTALCYDQISTFVPEIPDEYKA